MRKHITDAVRPPSSARLAAYLRMDKAAGRQPSRVAQFRKAGSTIRSMPLRQFLRIARLQSAQGISPLT